MMSTGIQRMLADIERELTLTAPYTGITRLNQDVIRAMADIARDEFVPSGMRAYAYDNRPLPIGHDQTISQPFIVALMTHLLNARKDARILEIGTGSGYQAAVLARVAGRVYSVERIPELSENTGRVLESLDLDNVELLVGDGYRGWPENAPYDGIIVTAAAPQIPPALPEQLAPGGRLVIPVGQPYGRQDLLLIEKQKNGELRSSNILPVAFVPLLNEEPDNT